jgi:hypothetical protein
MRLRAALATCLLLLVLAPAAATAATVSLSRAQVTTRLGDTFYFNSTVTNRGAAPAAGLVAHLNVASLTKGVYVDPEDWSSDRTRYLPVLPPGGSLTIPWKVKAVNGGRFAIYVAVLPSSGARSPVVSPALATRVTEHRTLNSGGVLPLAVGLPALIGFLAIGVRAAGRRLGG